MKLRILSINVIQMLRVSAILFALLGCLIAPVGVVQFMLGGKDRIMGLLSIFLFPLLYGAFGAVNCALFAFAYNASVKWTGGIEVTTEQIDVVSESPTGAKHVNPRNLELPDQPGR